MSVLEYVGALVWPTFAVEQVGSEAGMTCMDLIVDLDLGRATKYHSVHIFCADPDVCRFRLSGMFISTSSQCWWREHLCCL
jgi:hypothetical protein